MGSFFDALPGLTEGEDENYNLLQELPRYIEDEEDINRKSLKELPRLIEENQKNERRELVKFLVNQFYNINTSGYALDGCFKRIKIKNNEINF